MVASLPRSRIGRHCDCFFFHNRARWNWFFNRYLKNNSRPGADPDAGFLTQGPFPINASELPKDEINTTIDRTFVARARIDLPTAQTFEDWKRELLRRLRSQCFAAWPTRAPQPAVAALGNQPTEGRDSTEDGIEVFWRWLPGKDTIEHDMI